MEKSRQLLVDIYRSGVFANNKTNERPYLGSQHEKGAKSHLQLFQH
jgi:hypothetical protein